MHDCKMVYCLLHGIETICSGGSRILEGGGVPGL